MDQLPFPKPTGRKKDKAFLRAVHELPCLGRTVEPGHRCDGWGQPVDAAHQGSRSQNRKADDDTTIPLCHTLHIQMHHLAGPWRGWTREQLDAWKDWAIQDTRRKLKGMIR